MDESDTSVIRSGIVKCFMTNVCLRSENVIVRLQRLFIISTYEMNYNLHQYLLSLMCKAYLPLLRSVLFSILYV